MAFLLDLVGFSEFYRTQVCFFRFQVDSSAVHWVSLGVYH